MYPLVVNPLVSSALYLSPCLLTRSNVWDSEVPLGNEFTHKSQSVSCPIQVTIINPDLATSALPHSLLSYVHRSTLYRTLQANAFQK